MYISKQRVVMNCNKPTVAAMLTVSCYYHNKSEYTKQQAGQPDDQDLKTVTLHDMTFDRANNSHAETVKYLINKNYGNLINIKTCSH